MQLQHSRNIQMVCAAGHCLAEQQELPSAFYYISIRPATSSAQAYLQTAKIAVPNLRSTFSRHTIGP